ncbi:MAG: hypothetical protein P8014_05265 [Acidihalobacter sp.]|uniref:hypothetical protein n=1 Tax=Acidihalobacter sp. TaxID=1872108 RepID=UPI00307DE8EF
MRIMLVIYMSHMSIDKVFFDTKKIQKLGRIQLSDALLINAGLQVGDTVDIYFDTTSRQIIIRTAEVTPSPQSPAKDKTPKGPEV